MLNKTISGKTEQRCPLMERVKQNKRLNTPIAGPLPLSISSCEVLFCFLGGGVQKLRREGWINPRNNEHSSKNNNSGDQDEGNLCHFHHSCCVWWWWWEDVIWEGRWKLPRCPDETWTQNQTSMPPPENPLHRPFSVFYLATVAFAYHPLASSSGGKTTTRWWNHGQWILHFTWARMEGLCSLK